MIATSQHFHWLLSLFRWRVSKWKRSYCQPEIPEWMRTVVLSWDYHRCRICGEPGTEVDHVIPIALGGKTRLTNLRTLCKECNRKERNRLIYRKDS